MSQSLTLDEPFLLDDVVSFLETNDWFESIPLLKTPTGGDEVPMMSVFAQDFDAASQSSANSDDTASKSDRSSKREMEKDRQRRYRKRLKDTRQSLLDQIEELSAEVLMLWENGAKTTGKAPNSSWLTVLTRQRDKRRRSEEEYEQLVAAVNSQARYIKNLKCVALSHLAIDVTLIKDDLVSPRPAKVPRIYSMTNALHPADLQQLDGCYARVDEVVSASGLQSLPESTRFPVHRLENDGEVPYVQHLNKALLPFGFPPTCNALWKVLNMHDGDILDLSAPVPDNDTVEKIRLLRPPPESEIFQRYVSRRYVEANRFVVVWKMSSEGNGPFEGLRGVEFGWMCVQPTETGTQMEVCVHQAPMRCDLSRTREPAARQFFEILQSSLSKDKDMVAMAVGRLLMTEPISDINS